MPDILLLGLLAVCLWRIRWSKERTEDYLSRNSTTALRGVLALGVIFVHLGQFNSGGALFELVGRVGYLVVAGFFFLTGYGLQKQHMTRKDYAKGFLRKRLLTVVLPYLVVTGLYWSYYLWLGRGYDWRYVLMSFASGKPLASFSWYIPAVMTFYAAFWLLMRLCGKNHTAMIWGGTAWFVVYTTVCVVLKFGSWWYISAFPAVVGMIWAVYQSKIEDVLRKRWLAAMAAVLVGLTAVFALDKLITAAVVGTVLKAVTAVLFCVAVILVLYRLRLGNPILHYLGQMSMELYLMQGLAMMVLRNRVIFVEDTLLYCALVLPVTVVFAGILHIAFKGIPKKPTH